ncbi:hypothetical protein SVZ_N_04052 [Salmonella enterica subsp. enterica serovar Typhimurium]|nr:hypothetical protein SVZ_N_04052 [Salmonella enterica subsp. enterica serovar Typhimurium]
MPESTCSAIVSELTCALLTVSALISSYPPLLPLLVIKMPSPSALMVAPLISTLEARILIPMPLELMAIESLSSEMLTVEAFFTSMAAPVALSCVTVEFVISRTPLLDTRSVLSVPVELIVLSDTFSQELYVVSPTTRTWPFVSVITLPSLMLSVLPDCDTMLLRLCVVAVTLVPIRAAHDSPERVRMP